MKRIAAIVLLCLSAQLSAEGRCPYVHAERAEIARAWSSKPTLNRAEAARLQRVRALLAWQRAILFEQQIL